MKVHQRTNREADAGEQIGGVEQLFYWAAVREQTEQDTADIARDGKNQAQIPLRFSSLFPKRGDCMANRIGHQRKEGQKTECGEIVPSGRKGPIQMPVQDRAEQRGKHGRHSKHTNGFGTFLFHQNTPFKRLGRRPQSRLQNHDIGF